MPRVLIIGGYVANSSDLVSADVLIEGERVAAAGDGTDWRADEFVGAHPAVTSWSGGIDAHIQFGQPMSAFTARTFEKFRAGG